MNAVIIGGGPAGAFVGIHLRRRGWDVTIYEKRPNPLQQDAIQPRGRSINLALSRRGLDALRTVGLDEALLANSVPMTGRMIHKPGGRRRRLVYGMTERGEVLRSVSRAELNNLVLQKAIDAGVKIEFARECASVDLDGMELHFAGDGSGSAVKTDLIVGCDGTGSVVREAILGAGGDEPQSALRRLDYGYKELIVTSGRLEPLDALHIWPHREEGGEGYMLIALPNPDGSFTCTLFMPLQGRISFAALESAAQDRERRAAKFLREHFPEFYELGGMGLAGDLVHNPLGKLEEVDCSSWHWRDRAVLLSDAAHGIVPFLGQGVNAALQSALTLFECIDESPSDLSGAFEAYQSRRKPDADALAQMSRDNFREMRSESMDERFELKWELELELERRFPGRYRRRYSLIEFETGSYAEAQQRGVENDRITSKLLAGADTPSVRQTFLSVFENEIDWDLADRLLNTGNRQPITDHQ